MASSTIMVEARLSALRLPLEGYRPIITIDGVQVGISRGENIGSRSPRGRHEVSVSLGVFFRPMGVATLTVDVAEGQTIWFALQAAIYHSIAKRPALASRLGRTTQSGVLPLPPVRFAPPWLAGPPPSPPAPCPRFRSARGPGSFPRILSGR
jgi:hypothetical protein